MFQRRSAGRIQEFDGQLGFYTPILKGFLTEMGLERAATWGAGVRWSRLHQEHGMEQIVPCASPPCEGTAARLRTCWDARMLLSSKGSTCATSTCKWSVRQTHPSSAPCAGLHGPRCWPRALAIRATMAIMLRAQGQGNRRLGQLGYLM